MKRLSSVQVVVTCWNDLDKIEKCLRSIFNQDYPKFKVFIVDDGSTDGTVDYIQKNFPKAKIFVLKKGPSQNRNIALKKDKSEFVITMDSDAILISKNWISSVVKFMQDNSRIGMLGGKLLLNDSTINSAGGIMSLRGNGFDRGHGDSRNNKEYDSQKEVIYVSTATSVLRRKMLEEIGLFDEDYGHGFEDADLGLRANISGWKVLYNPTLESYHLADYRKGEKARLNPNINYYLKKNKISTLFKNYQKSTLIRFLPLYILNFIYNLLFQKYRLSTLSAYLWNWKNKEILMKKRRFIQERRKVPDKVIFKSIYFRI